MGLFGVSLFHFNTIFFRPHRALIQHTRDCRKLNAKWITFHAASQLTCFVGNVKIIGVYSFHFSPIWRRKSCDSLANVVFGSCRVNKLQKQRHKCSIWKICSMMGPTLFVPQYTTQNSFHIIYRYLWVFGFHNNAFEVEPRTLISYFILK